MARMIPTQLVAGAPPSEAEIFRRLGDQTPSEWIAIHSQEFVQSADQAHPAIEGEIDFLVLVPEWGYLALEVKGGGVHVQDGTWHTRNQSGEINPIKDPAAQARQGAHAVDEFLMCRSWFKQNQVRPRFGWGVIFPDVDLPANTGMALPRDHVLDRLDCTHFANEMRRLIDAQGFRARPYPPEFPNEFLEAVCPTLDARVPLAKWFSEEGEIQDRFTQEQIRLLDCLVDRRRLAIEGAAGTGKTVVAMEKARRLVEDGQKVLFLCFNRPLAEDLRQHAAGFEVLTFHDYAFRCTQQAGMKVSVPKKDTEKTDFYDEDLPVRMLEALPQLKEERYDALVVDEGQDFKKGWWECVNELLKDPAHGIFYVFFDPLQDIYGRGLPDFLEMYPYPLRFNCRNTGKITDFCRELSGSVLETFPGIPPGLDVETIDPSKPEALRKKLDKLVARLVLKDKVRPESIALLSTRSRKASALKGVQKLGPLRLVPLGAAGGANQLRFDSLFRFKGLETDVVILVDEGHPKTSTPNHLYVGASRARHLLIFAQIETSVAPPSTPPTSH